MSIRRGLRSSLCSTLLIVVFFILPAGMSLLLISLTLLGITLGPIIYALLHIVIVFWNFTAVLSVEIVATVALIFSSIPWLVRVSVTWLLIIAGWLLVSMVIAVALPIFIALRVVRVLVIVVVTPVGV